VALERGWTRRAWRSIVRDSGIGIARSDLEKLGKPFAQAEHAVMRAKEGTGLGLALVKSTRWSCMAAR